MKSLNEENLKNIFDYMINHEENALDREILIYTEGISKEFIKKFDEAFNDVMSEWQKAVDVDYLYDKDSYFDACFKFAKYKNHIFAFRLMYGQGSSEEIWDLGINLSSKGWENAKRVYAKVSGSIKIGEFEFLGQKSRSKIIEDIKKTFPDKKDSFIDFALENLNNEVLLRFLTETPGKNEV